MQHNSSSSETSTPKPSLMSKPSLSSKQAGDIQELSILSSVKSSSVTSAAINNSPKASRFKLMAVGLLAILATYFVYQYTLSIQQQGEPNSRPSVIANEKAEATLKNTPIAAAQSPATATVSSDLSPTVAVVAPEAAAQIINEAATQPAPVNSEGKLTAALEEGVKPPDAAIEKALASAAPAKTVEAPAIAAKPSATEKSSATKPKTITAKAPAAKAVANKPAEASANNKPVGTTAADKDVNLIAALLSHGTGATPKAKSATAPNTSASAGSSAEPANASLDATALALKQCGDLNFIEREACRFKACNNQWETNAACKATMSAASPKP
jgi:hypothetical protein